MKKGLILLAAVFVLLFTSCAAEAWSLRVYNNCGRDILEVYVRPNSGASWGRDLTGRNYIKNGNSFDFTIPNYQSYNLRVVYKNGQSTNWVNIKGQTNRFYVNPNGHARWRWD